MAAAFVCVINSFWFTILSLSEIFSCLRHETTRAACKKPYAHTHTLSIIQKYIHTRTRAALMSVRARQKKTRVRVADSFIRRTHKSAEMLCFPLYVECLVSLCRHETPILAKRIQLVHVDEELVALDKPCSLPVSHLCCAPFISQTQKRHFRPSLEFFPKINCHFGAKWVKIGAPGTKIETREV